MAEYFIDDATLTAIANAIRGKNGSSSKYTPAQMATAIAAISGGGGGLPSGIAKIAEGTYTVASDFTTTTQTVTHNLGVVPDFLIIWKDGSNVATTYSMLWAMRSSRMPYRSSSYTSFMCYHGNSTTSTTLTNSNNANYGIGNSPTATTFNLQSASTSYYWRAGTYRWMVIKFN